MTSTTKRSHQPGTWATFSYGFGEVQIRLGRIGRNGDVSLDGKVRYLRGQQAEILEARLHSTRERFGVLRGFVV
ncbi:MAG: hypothetical protein WAV20_22035 [Blastocatellia bacterium]